MWGRRSSRTAVLGIASAAFGVVCILPLAYMLAQAGASGGDHAALLLDARQRSLLSNTAALGIGTALLATLIGAPLGLALARVAVPSKPVWRIALSAPVLLPPYVMGLAWVHLTGSAGSEWTYSLPGAIVVLGLVFYPLSMLATEIAARRVEPRLEEAALVVASPGRIVRRITLPLVVPSIAAAALVIFVLAISEFGVPGLLRVRVFTTEVCTAFAALYDFGRATILALPLLGLSIVVAAYASASHFLAASIFTRWMYSTGVLFVAFLKRRSKLRRPMANLEARSSIEILAVTFSSMKVCACRIGSSS